MALACQPTKESLPALVEPFLNCPQEQGGFISNEERCERGISPQLMDLAGKAPDSCEPLALWNTCQLGFESSLMADMVDWQERLLYNGLTDTSGIMYPIDIRGYLVKDSALFLTHFFPFAIRDILHDIPFNLSLETQFPADGKMRWTLFAASSIDATLMVRIPGWSDNRPSPSKSHRYWHKTNRKMTLSVDGEWVFPKVENGFAVIPGTWNGEHIIELNLPLSVRKIITQNPLQGVDSFALGWGPLLYGLGLDDVPEKGFSPEARWAVRQDTSGCLPYIEGPPGSSPPLPYQRLQQNGAYFLPVQK